MRKASVAIAAALLASLAAPVTAHASEDVTRVMVLGDSITQGAIGHHTWRYHFAQSIEDVDFVGNKRGTFSIYGGDWDYTGPNAYAVSGWDSDHAAVWGGSMTNPDPEPKLYQLPIGELSATYQPDVIVSAWGINDINKGVTPAALIGHYEEWIADARRVQPGVDFVISELAWTWGAYGTRVTDFNALLDGLAERNSTEDSPVVIARMTEPYTKDADTYDGIHPNEQGEEKIARMVGAAYETLPVGESPSVDPTPGPTPEPAPIPVPVVAEPQPVTPAVVEAIAPPATVVLPVAPSQPSSVKATRRHKMVKVRWQKAAGADAYRVRCGGKSKTADGTRTKIRSTSKRCKVQAVNAVGASRWVSVRIR